MASLPRRAPFPTTPDEFQNDTRVSYSTVESKWQLEEEDSTWEYDEKLGKWIQSVCLSPFCAIIIP
jgi:HIV Tat-specific factor 1